MVRKLLKTNVDTLNLFFLCILSSLIIFTPFYPYKKMIILVVFFILWFITATRDTKWNYKVFPIILLMLGMMILDFLSSIGNDNEEIFRNFITQKLFVYIWIPIFTYYIDKREQIRKIIPIIFVMIIISGIFTIYGNMLYPGASRLLASVNSQNALYHSMFIGGYDFIYGLVFIILPSIIYARRRRCSVFFYIFFLLIVMATIITGAYTIAILLSLLMIIMSFVNTNTMPRSIVFLIIMFVIVILLSDQLLDVMIYIGNKIGSEILVHRAEMIRNMDFVESSGENRVILYQNGLINFSKNILVGKIFGVSSVYLPAGHSALINYLESYGLLSIFYFALLYKTYKVTMRAFGKTPTHYYYLFYFMVLLLFMLINTIDTANGIGFFAFFFGPIVLLCSEKQECEVLQNGQY